MIYFDPVAELERLRITKKQHNFTSKIDRFSYEILRLRTAGATLEELQLYLQKNRVSVSLAALSRWLKKHASTNPTPAGENQNA